MTTDGLAAAAGTRRTGRILLAILLLGAILRGLYLAELADQPDTYAPALDGAFHAHWAKALATGDWSPPRDFPDPELQHAPYFRPPGYPYFLAALHLLTGGQPLLLRALQMLLGLASVWLGFRLGRALAGDRVGLLLAAGLASTWSIVYFEGELLAPPLAIALLLLGLERLHCWAGRGGIGLGLLSGGLFGLLALTVPNGLALLPVVLGYGWWCARRGGPGGPWPLALGMVLAIAPATLRNAVVGGEFVLISSNGGVNLYIGNNPAADGATARIPILGDLAPLQGWTCFDQPALVRGVARQVGHPVGAAEASRWFTARAVDHVLAEPAHTLGLVARKAALFLGPGEVANNRELAIARSESKVLRWLPTFPVVLALAVLGALRLVLARRGGDRGAFVLLGLLGFAWFASHLPFFVAGRYRVPLLPVLWLFAAIAVDDLWRHWRERGPRQTLGWVLGGAVLLAVLHVDWVGVQPDRANWHFQRGDACRRLGDGTRAVAEFRLALEHAPGHAAARTNLGALLLQQGQTAAALEALRAAVTAAPEAVEARVNLALGLASVGDTAGAIGELMVVVQRAPDLPGPQTQLGALLLRAGEPTKAVAPLAAATRLAPGDPRAAHLLALAQREAGDAAAGRTTLEALLQRHPDYVDGRCALVDLLLAQGDRAGARREWQQAAARAPQHPEVVRLAAVLR